MPRTAILVDGNFYLHRSRRLWGDKPAGERAEELYSYALGHLTASRDAKVECGRRSLYRIFYYDCPPLDEGSVWQPWDGKNRSFSRRHPANAWMSEFHAALGTKRKVAMRMGTLMARNAHFTIKQESLKALMRGEVTAGDLGESDFVMTGVKQAGVDMRIGLDVASLASDRIVDQIVLVAGDADFVPVAKAARRAGVDFLVDPMGHHITDELSVQIDGVEDLSGAARG